MYLVTSMLLNQLYHICLRISGTVFKLMMLLFDRDDHGHHDHESYYGDRDTDSLVKVKNLLRSS